MNDQGHPGPQPTSMPHDDAPARRGRPWTGAVAITLAVLAVGAVVLMLSPAARQQLELSSQRRTAPYLELYFVDQASARACLQSDGHADVRAAVFSHLDSAQPIAWTVSTVRADGTALQTAHGSLATEPGFATEMSARLAVPRKQEYSLDVTLPAAHQSVFVHCGTSP